jgi:hypothetical protein
MAAKTVFRRDIKSCIAEVGIRVESAKAVLLRVRCDLEEGTVLGLDKSLGGFRRGSAGVSP